MQRVSAALSGVVDLATESAGAVAGLLRNPHDCQVCRLLRSEEREHVARLAQFLSESASQEAYARGRGVCLRHLALLVAAAPSADLARFLVGAAARQFDQIAEDMRNYAIKRDAIRSGLLTDDEDEAYLRALVRLAGHKGLCGAWPSDASL